MSISLGYLYRGLYNVTLPNLKMTQIGHLEFSSYYLFWYPLLKAKWYMESIQNSRPRMDFECFSTSYLRQPSSPAASFTVPVLTRSTEIKGYGKHKDVYMMYWVNQKSLRIFFTALDQVNDKLGMSRK